MGVGGTFVSSGDTSNDQAHFSIWGQTYFGIDPNIDTAANKTTTTFSNGASFINQTGLIIHADAGSNDSRALITLDLPCYLVSLSHNMASQIKNIPDNFVIIKMQAGIMISNLINLHVSGALWSSAKSILNTPYVVAVQFSPAQAFNKSAPSK